MKKKEKKVSQNELIDHILKNDVTDKCMVWPGGVNKDGYPLFQNPETKKTARVTRYICEKHNGLPPTDTDQKYHAAHSCGRRDCINKKHLSWKTAKENNADKIDQGKNSRAGLDILSVITIFESNKPASELAKEFSVSPSTIYHIQNATTWGSLLEQPLHTRKTLSALTDLCEAIQNLPEDDSVIIDEYPEAVDKAIRTLAELDNLDLNLSTDELLNLMASQGPQTPPRGFIPPDLFF